jgi:hypothetical protein
MQSWIVTPFQTRALGQVRPLRVQASQTFHATIACLKIRHPGDDPSGDPTLPYRPNHSPRRARPSSSDPGPSLVQRGVLCSGADRGTGREYRLEGNQGGGWLGDSGLPRDDSADDACFIPRSLPSILSTVLCISRQDSCCVFSS